MQMIRTRDTQIFKRINFFINFFLLFSFHVIDKLVSSAFQRVCLRTIYLYVRLSSPCVFLSLRVLFRIYLIRFAFSVRNIMM